MKILILGGTLFVGRHLTEALLAAGHEVTLFNRGKTNPDLFPQAERLRGDRDGDLESLRGGNWDAVVDVNGYLPRQVRESTRLMRDTVDHYIFISTGAVYQRPFPKDGDERAPLVDLSIVDDYEDSSKYYAELKVLCERAAEEEMPGRVLVLRLGLMVGPYDETDRASYWVWRTALGGEMLAPGKAGDAFQVVDARDLAQFILMCLESKTTGVYNATGRSISWGEWLATCQKVAGSEATFTWIDEERFLEENRPNPDLGLFLTYPLYIPKNWGDWWNNNNDRAQRIGLTYRPIEDTVQDILAWVNARPPDHKWRAGITLEQERGILEAWKRRV